MDILNFISWIKGGRVVTSVDPTQTLLPVGLKDNRRDDGYLAGAITVEDFAAQLSPYKVYTAILSQSGTSNPSDTILMNTIDVNLSWEYLSTGQYRLSLPSFPSNGPFIVGKTFVFIGSGKNNNVPLYANNNTAMGVLQNNAIIVRNFDTSFVQQDNFENVSIEIRVYS
jgi:hypothetical protein